MVDIRHAAVRSTRLIKAFQTDELLFRRQLKNAGSFVIEKHKPFKHPVKRTRRIRH